MIDIACKAAAAPLTQAQDSDERFRTVLAAVKPTPAKSKTNQLRDGEGGKIGKVASNSQRLVVTIDRKTAPGFADYLSDKLPELYCGIRERWSWKVRYMSRLDSPTKIALSLVRH